MHRSYWDIEVYAKDFQSRRRQEATQRRLADEAAAAGAVNPFNLAIARILNAWKSRLASAPAANAPRPATEPEVAGKTEPVSQPYRPNRMRLAQPYADMVVVARGPMAGVAEQPCGVSDC